MLRKLTSTGNISQMNTKLKSAHKRISLQLLNELCANVKHSANILAVIAVVNLHLKTFITSGKHLSLLFILNKFYISCQKQLFTPGNGYLLKVNNKHSRTTSLILTLNILYTLF